MNPNLILLLVICLIVLQVVVIILLLVYRKNTGFAKPIQDLELTLSELGNRTNHFESLLKDEFQRNRKENQESDQRNRKELGENLSEFSRVNTGNNKDLNDLIRQKFGDFNERQIELFGQSIKQLKDLQEAIEKQLVFIRDDNAKQLTEIRKTVDKKLQKTLNERLNQSFETVGKQLIAVQEGLGEMKNLAADVGGLKRVLSNVKLRGNLGEIQLSMLLEQILAPDQYAANVNTNPANNNVVEFAIKLPGKESTLEQIWLPIDAKFPKDAYEELQMAFEEGDPEKMEKARKVLSQRIKGMARDIHEKYIAPPHTTNFGILFLPFEGLYAEIVRDSNLLQDLQRDFQIIVTGPTTLAAILNSLQMGFKTLAIQQRSSEVWKVLGAVKTEFGKFGGLLEKAQDNIRKGLNQLDEVKGVRTRVMVSKLNSVSKLSSPDSETIFPELKAKENEED